MTSCSIASVTPRRRAIRISRAASSIPRRCSTSTSRTSGRSPRAAIVEQRITRVRKSITRVAWNGTRPIISEVARAWAGAADDQDLSDADLATAREHALALMTPTAFPDGDHPVTLDPSMVAQLMDTAVRTLLTAPAARRPEVARRVAVGRRIAAPLVDARRRSARARRLRRLRVRRLRRACRSREAARRRPGRRRPATAPAPRVTSARSRPRHRT